MNHLQRVIMWHNNDVDARGCIKAVEEQMRNDEHTVAFNNRTIERLQEENKQHSEYLALTRKEIRYQERN